MKETCEGQSQAPSQPRSMKLPGLDGKYAQLLGGSGSINMRSGCVILAPGEAVGLHSTHENEEMVIPLDGTGELRAPGFETQLLQPGFVFYNPPHTPHDVVNTGDQPLRYIYVVAKIPLSNIVTRE